MPDLAIIAALTRELAPLAQDLHATRISSSNGILLQSASLPSNSGQILLVTAGMGSERISLAVAAALAHRPVTTLLSVGLAGACDPALIPGSVLEASLVIDSNSGERFTPADHSGIAPRGILVTTPHIASPAEKLRLFAAYNAAAVDMEAATVARLARAHGIPFAALKAISDDHAADLTHLTPFSGAHGQFRTAPFALHTALHPRLWRPTIQLGRDSKAAVHALTAAMKQWLTHPLSPSS